MPNWEIRGDSTGKLWRCHITLDRLESNGERWRARADDGSSAVLHRCEKGTYWDDEIERMRVAIELGRQPAVARCSTIRQLLDVHETEPQTVVGVTVPGVLVEICEWADYGLNEWLRREDRGTGAAIVEEVAANVAAALDVLHGLGVVHCDVAPNNILLVDGMWKLADLDSCVPIGEQVIRGPIVERQRYQHPDRRDGPATARIDFDEWGLEQVLAKIEES